MTSILTYSIADAYFQVCSPDIAATRNVLGKAFTPFEIPTDKIVAGGHTPLYRLTSGKLPVIDEDYKVIKTVKGEKLDIRFRTNHKGDLLVMIKLRNKQVRGLYISADQKLFLTNASFIDVHDQLFLISFIKLAFCLTSLQLGILKIHASAISYEGEALLFLGDSGTGKSTHSKLWLQHIIGATLLNDDEPHIRYIDGHWYAYGAPWSGKTPCYKAERTHLAAFVRLYQSPHNILRKLDAASALQILYASTTNLYIIPKIRNSVSRTILDLANVCPVYSLECRPDKGAVTLTYSIIHKKNGDDATNY